MFPEHMDKSTEILDTNRHQQQQNQVCDLEKIIQIFFTNVLTTGGWVTGKKALARS